MSSKKNIKYILVTCLTIFLLVVTILLIKDILMNDDISKETNLGDYQGKCCIYHQGGSLCIDNDSKCPETIGKIGTCNCVGDAPSSSSQSTTSSGNNSSSTQSSDVASCMNNCIISGVSQSTCATRCNPSNGNQGSSSGTNTGSNCIISGVSQSTCATRCNPSNGNQGSSSGANTGSSTGKNFCKGDLDCQTGFCNQTTHLCENNNSSNSNNNGDNSNNNQNSNQQEELIKQCFVRRSTGINNEYCYGTNETCQGFSEVASDKTEYTCNENDACYVKYDGTYVLGKFDKQSGYQYYGMTCPACYEDTNGEYRWTNTPNANEKVVLGINTLNQCVTPSKTLLDNKKIIFIALIVVIVIALFIVLKSMKRGNNQNNMSTEY